MQSARKANMYVTVPLQMMDAKPYCFTDLMQNDIPSIGTPKRTPNFGKRPYVVFGHIFPAESWKLCSRCIELNMPVSCSVHTTSGTAHIPQDVIFHRNHQKGILKGPATLFPMDAIEPWFPCNFTCSFPFHCPYILRP